MNRHTNLARRLVAVLAVVALALALLPAASVSGAVKSEIVWLDTYEAHDGDTGGDGAAGPVFTSDVLKQGYPYQVTVKGTYSIWYPSLWETAGPVCGVPEPSPMFPSRNTSNGKVGVDAQWAFAAPDCTYLGSGQVPPVRWPMVEFSLDGGTEWTPREASNVGTGPNPAHTYVFFLTGQGQKLGVRLWDWFTRDNYGRLQVRVIALPVDDGIDVEAGS